MTEILIVVSLVAGAVIGGVVVWWVDRG